MFGARIRERLFALSLICKLITLKKITSLKSIFFINGTQFNNVTIFSHVLSAENDPSIHMTIRTKHKLWQTLTQGRNHNIYWGGRPPMFKSGQNDPPNILIFKYKQKCATLWQATNYAVWNDHKQLNLSPPMLTPWLWPCSQVNLYSIGHCFKGCLLSYLWPTLPTHKRVIDSEYNDFVWKCGQLIAYLFRLPCPWHNHSLLHQTQRVHFDWVMLLFVPRVVVKQVKYLYQWICGHVSPQTVTVAALWLDVAQQVVTIREWQTLDQP